MIQNSKLIQKEHLFDSGMHLCELGWGWGQSRNKIQLPNCFTENLISMNSPRMTLITQQVLDKCMLIN